MSIIIQQIDKRIDGKGYGDIHTRVPLLQFQTYGRYLTQKAKLVYLALLSTDFDFNREKDENNRVSYATLATLTNMGINACREGVMELEHFGWIGFEQDYRNANRYFTRDTFPTDETGLPMLCPTKEQAVLYRRGKYDTYEEPSGMTPLEVQHREPCEVVLATAVQAPVLDLLKSFENDQKEKKAVDEIYESLNHDEVSIDELNSHVEYLEREGYKVTPSSISNCIEIPF